MNSQTRSISTEILNQQEDLSLLLANNEDLVRSMTSRATFARNLRSLRPSSPTIHRTKNITIQNLSPSNSITSPSDEYSCSSAPVTNVSQDKVSERSTTKTRRIRLHNHAEFNSHDDHGSSSVCEFHTDTSKITTTRTKPIIIEKMHESDEARLENENSESEDHHLVQVSMKNNNSSNNNNSINNHILHHNSTTPSNESKMDNSLESQYRDCNNNMAVNQNRTHHLQFYDDDEEFVIFENVLYNTLENTAQDSESSPTPSPTSSPSRTPFPFSRKNKLQGLIPNSWKNMFVSTKKEDTSEKKPIVARKTNNAKKRKSFVPPEELLSKWIQQLSLESTNSLSTSGGFKDLMKILSSKLLTQPLTTSKSSKIRKLEQNLLVSLVDTLIKYEILTESTNDQPEISPLSSNDNTNPTTSTPNNNTTTNLDSSNQNLYPSKISLQIQPSLLQGKEKEIVQSVLQDFSTRFPLQPASSSRTNTNTVDKQVSLAFGDNNGSEHGQSSHFKINGKSPSSHMTQDASQQNNPQQQNQQTTPNQQPTSTPSISNRSSMLLMSFDEFLHGEGGYSSSFRPSPRVNGKMETESHSESLEESSVLSTSNMESSSISTPSSKGVLATTQPSSSNEVIGVSAVLTVLTLNIGSAANDPATTNTSGEANNNEVTTDNTKEEKQPEGTPYERKLMFGEKSLFDMKSQLKGRHRYGFLTPMQFLDFGLRAGFDEDEFASIFAVTYSTFMSTHQLIPMLEFVMKVILNDEKVPQPLDEEEEENIDHDLSGASNIIDNDCKLSSEEKNLVIRRVVCLLKHFVSLAFSDFQFDKQFHEMLYSFVAPLSGFIQFEATNGESVQEQVCDLVERITLVISGAHEDQHIQPNPPKPLIKKIPNDPRKINMIDIDPVEVARQLTLFEFSSFEKITAKELLGASWMKETKEWTAPNITQVIWRSNQMTDWVGTYICSIKNLKERRKALKHLIQVADACLDMHNYNTVFEIVMGLISQPVYRLKKTWEVVKEQELQKAWKRLEDITSFQQSRKAYRDQIKKVIKESVDKLTPCLPYLGIHLSDLVFFDEGNKDKMEKGVTTYYNFTKRALMGQIVYQIIAVKKIPYNFQKVDFIEEFLWWQLNSKVLHDESERDKLSRQCE
ncbi:hypothetical protein C9374_005045 [Naegleria lovaniensis]|uniref:Ras-GEF domain-containing protein n=1 Tax=Naegleria lovaniensis TaxID=51637 RepID=A0AA88GLK4_NAELO|nr:uncharacterized protein C9374_005045 [Naegleria lovaniensis]KAG2382465.1 hypothetical protein C9374_005045 [Naegleria lovaniensis]